MTVALLAGTVVSVLSLTLPLWASALIAFAVFAAATAVVVAAGLRGVRRGVPPVPVDTVRNLASSPE
ncbi:hypothetical protein GCM10009561_28120 [Frigoribacterium faeni]|nr:hypothetical protein GCM10025699_39820 [Microbacterium flavescens]BFF16326.1 hypothetical protein GCM10025699_76290 [Microbacterium flavescens]